MRTLFFTALALLLSLSSLAQPAYSSYDTIPGRYRGYHYTEWYDQCPAFSNGGIIDSVCYEKYLMGDNCNRIAKYEYTDHPILIRGLVALVRQGTVSYYSWLSNELGPQYLYLLKRIDYTDTVNPDTLRAQLFKMRILDSIRYDTVKPKIMEIPQAYPYIPNNYLYAFEVYFDKPIQVDSDFYISGTSDHKFIPETQTFTYRPFAYANITPTAQEINQPYEHNSTYPNLCHSQGHHNTMVYYGHSSWTSIGYPPLNNGEVWCERTRHIYPDDPFGVYLAIVDHYELKLYSDSLPMGSVMGSGYYDENATAECLAIPNPGFVFSHWNDGNTQNPRYIHLSQDTALTAFFAEGCMYHVDLFSDNPSLGSVLGGGDYPSNSMVSISATPSSNAYAFYHWNDGNTLNPRTFRLTQDTSFSAFFTENWRYHVELHSGMPDWGSVEGEGDYFANSQVSISATPLNSSYVFYKWRDNDTCNPRTFTITQDTVFVALFQRVNGILETPDAQSCLSLRPNPASDRVEIVSCEAMATIDLYDVSGRPVLHFEPISSSASLDLSLLAPGLYTLRATTQGGIVYTDKLLVTHK